MKNFNKLTAAVALTLGVGIAAPQVGAAPIELKRDGIGDALLYPAFVGYFENYFTIQNSSNSWLQGHIRFRGAAWSAELLDFDVILSPGDVMLFRLADLDGDGQWEIDQSLDPLNFRYTSVTRFCGGGAVDNCMDASNALEPTPGVVSESLLNHQRNVGYIEFIGECELRGMTSQRMSTLLAGSTTGMHPRSLSLVPNGYTIREGTNCWAWSDAGELFALDTNGPVVGGVGTYGLGDFPNAASGTGFIRLPGRAFGMSYVAETFVNFRTENSPHRVDSYRIANGVDLDAADPAASQRNRAVIVHNEDSNAKGGPFDRNGVFRGTPYGHYVYLFDQTPGPGDSEENRLDEALISFNNTWGPTLADGDDYDMTGAAQTIDGAPRNIYDGVGALRPVDITGVFDDWDIFHRQTAGVDTAGAGDVNSIAEVEEAIRLGGQSFTGFYVNNDNALGGGSTLQSWYFAHFPTKFYYGEDPVVLAASPTRESYIDSIVANLLVTAKPVDLEFWDIFEDPAGQSQDFLNISPALPVESEVSALSQELSIFNIDFFQNVFRSDAAAQLYTQGRIVVDMTADGAGDPRDVFFGDLNPTVKLSWPGLIYTFEAGAGLSELTHWRPLNR